MSRDNDIYVAAVDLLKATNAFTEVTYGEPLNVGPTPADTQYLCVINHTSDSELDDVDPIQIVRTCTATIQIDVREQDPETRVNVLDRLGNTVRKTLNGQSLASLTLPPLTLCRRGSLGKPSHPNQTLTLSFEFAYLIDGYGGHDDA